MKQQRKTTRMEDTRMQNAIMEDGKCLRVEDAKRRCELERKHECQIKRIQTYYVWYQIIRYDKYLL